MIKPIISSIKSTLKAPTSVSLTGERNLQISDIVNVANNETKLRLSPTPKVKARLKKIHQTMLDQVKSGTSIYGVTSAYGGQAGRVLTKGIKKKRIENATKLSEAIIHVDVSTGDPLPQNIVKAAMLIRINMLLPGHSAVRLSSLKILQQLLNAGLVPVVGRYGTVGASGDLAQNGRVLSALLQNPITKVFTPDGKITSAALALKEHNIPLLKLAPKEGLGLVNGDNFSTAATALQAHELSTLMLINLSTAALTIQSIKGSDRNFHPLLTDLRRHPGQKLTADILRGMLQGSKLSHQEMTGHKTRLPGEIIQDAYSIRCLPQYHGPNWETLAQIWKTIEINANGVSDNPLWTTPEHTTKGEEPYQWVSGGNFLAMHMADALDKMRKITVHIVKQNDRHLARLVHPHLNNGLTANLSDESSISHCTFKGLQTQMGMYEVYATVLANPVNTSFGTHEELNQDITSHALTSAIINWEVLKLARLAIATNLISNAQAIDLRGGPKLLSPATKPVYNWVRKQVPYIKDEQPLGHYVETIAENLSDKDLILHIINSLSIDD